MHVRVVRFTDVNVDQLNATSTRIQEEGGPPPGVSATRLIVLHDESQATAVVLQFYDSAEDMESSARVLDAMDASETPGRRASVDACMLKLDRKA
jgi:hypothetical protein